MTKVVIIGAGKGGRALLEMFAGDPTVTILGVADVNPWAPGLELARRLNIPVATDLRGLIADPRLDLVPAAAAKEHLGPGSSAADQEPRRERRAVAHRLRQARKRRNQVTEALLRCNEQIGGPRVGRPRAEDSAGC